MNELNSVYKRGGFDLTKIRCDNEFQAALYTIMETYDPPIPVNYANLQEHVPQSDRNNRYIKEHFNVVYHILPFYRLSREMVNYLVLTLARNPNMFLANHKVSKY